MLIIVKITAFVVKFSFSWSNISSSIRQLNISDAVKITQTLHVNNRLWKRMRLVFPLFLFYFITLKRFIIGLIATLLFQLLLDCAQQCCSLKKGRRYFLYKLLPKEPFKFSTFFPRYWLTCQLWGYVFKVRWDIRKYSSVRNVRGGIATLTMACFVSFDWCYQTILWL